MQSCDNRPRFLFRFFVIAVSMSSTSVFPVRATALRDAKAISDLYALVARDLYQSLLGTDQLPPLGQDKRQAFWREAIEFAEPQVMAALHGDRIVGFVGFDRSRDAGSRQTTGEITDIYVHPDFQGLGVGLSLWHAARQGLHDEGCIDVTLWLQARNKTALRFFELAGFKREPGAEREVQIAGHALDELRLQRNLI